MIRWNKWTRDYTYTYEMTDGIWKLIHKKSNRPIVHWVKSWYSMYRNRLSQIGKTSDDSYNQTSSWVAISKKLVGFPYSKG